jgi:hypothetical protein
MGEAASIVRQVDRVAAGVDPDRRPGPPYGPFALVAAAIAVRLLTAALLALAPASWWRSGLSRLRTDIQLYPATVPESAFNRLLALDGPLPASAASGIFAAGLLRPRRRLPLRPPRRVPQRRAAPGSRSRAQIAARPRRPRLSPATMSPADTSALEFALPTT